MTSTPTPPPPPSIGPGPRPRRHAALQLWLVNVAFGVFLGLSYLRHVPESENPRVWLFALPALVSQVALLTLLPGALLALWASLARPSRLYAPAQAVTWALFHVLLYADTRIYNVFRYHFNGQVVNLLFARGSEDAVYLGWTVWAAVLGGLALVGALQHLIWRALLRRAERVLGRRSWRRVLRPALVWVVVLLPAVFLEKSLYAQADLEQDREVIALSRLFPLYPRIPVEDLASAVLGVELPERPRIELDGVALDYPLEAPAIDPDGPRPNVLVIGIDCWRRDMLDPEVTPRLAAFAEQGRRFENHLSAGNSTRFGLFALLYGLPGSYWFPILNERRSPVLVDSLLELDYELGVFSSASMDYPELRSTAWVRIPGRVQDDFPSELQWRRDEMAAGACASWLEARVRRGDERPFFGFLMLDSPHQKYSYPPGHEPFRPSARDVDYMVMSAPDGPPPALVESVFNRYRNAVHHADRVAGELLDTLEGLGLTGDTLVVVTGDHGEEFLENGLFGHTSTFGPYQVKVPLVLRGPGIEPGIEARPTSHMDFAPTLLELLGADPGMRELWCLGGNLLDPPEELRRVVSGWNEVGLWTPDGIIRIPLSWGAFDVELYDYEWELVGNPRYSEVLEREAPAVKELAADCNRFLR